MKILFFIESLESGGKERRLVELLKNIRKSTNYSIELVLTRTGIAYKEILDLNIVIHIIERKAGKKDPRLFYLFFKIARKFKPDVINVWGNMVAIYAIPAKVLLRTPMINSQITDAPLNVYHGLLNHKIPFLFSNIIISNSKAGLVSYKSPNKKSRVIYNGFNPERIKKLKPKNEVKAQFSISTKNVIGMVATFSKLKDYSTYIQAANLVLGANNDTTFLCVGAGDDSAYRLIVNDENKDKIIFTGQQNDVESIMNCCDIGVLSTYTEGISNSVMEFMALGKTVIVTGGGGTAELLENGKSGFIIESQKPDLLADKILSLLADSNALENIGIEAKKRIENEFSMNKMLQSYISIFDSFDAHKDGSLKST